MASITKRENANGTVSWKVQVRIEGYPARTASHKTERAAKRWTATVKAAGITGLVFHGLRHTAASWLAGSGATEQQLRAIGGWKSNVVSRYVHLAARDTRGAVEKLAAQVGNTKPAEST
jgi:integrase